jgi:prevent-host-death family protein
MKKDLKNKNNPYPTYTSTEAKNKFGELGMQVMDKGNPVMIENYGKIKMVLIPYEQYEEYQQLKEKQRRQEIWKKLEALREKIQSRMTEEISEEEALRIGDEITREAIQSLEDKGIIKFEK